MGGEGAGRVRGRRSSLPLPPWPAGNVLCDHPIELAELSVLTEGSFKKNKNKKTWSFLGSQPLER